MNMLSLSRSALARRVGLLALAGALLAPLAHAQAPAIVMASTTSTEQSGLFAHLLPEFKRASGIDVKVVALGTGQAIDMGRRALHDEGAAMLRTRLAERVAVDTGTARRLFTLVCVLQMRPTRGQER